jgi:hypothetical protein
MNTIKMRGGLGNQMFQYAFGQLLRRQGKEVQYDVSWYIPRRTTYHPHPRPLRIDKFNVQHFVTGRWVKGNKKVQETQYDPQVFTQNNCNFDGYWQYYVYYEGILEELKQEFTLKEQYYTQEFLRLKQEIDATNSISVHVRRGDYLLQRAGGFRELPALYYFDAIRTVEGPLYITSDDMGWCRAVFQPDYTGRSVTFVDLPDYLAFELMRWCKHNVITNSTFSWWAAVLKEKEGRVICPVHYPGDTVERSAELRYPKQWEKIEDYV